MEGPYLSPQKAGAQNKSEIKNFSDLSVLYLIKCYKEIVKMITIAPELEKAEGEIAELAKDFIVSLGHTEADGKKAAEAFQNGASCVTHLFNAMSRMTHRELGVTGAALARDSVYTELICDGYHVLPEVINMVFKLKPKEKILLITDSVDAAGGPVGEYSFAGLPVIYDGEKVNLKYDGNLAGSALTIDKAVRNAMLFTGKTLEEIIPAVTLNPAKMLGISDKKGSVELSKDADFVLLDERYMVREVYLKGSLEEINE
jgi:N-acetylglucosamine-6-phosphate deacetylase